MRAFLSFVAALFCRSIALPTPFSSGCSSAVPVKVYNDKQWIWQRMGPPPPQHFQHPSCNMPVRGDGATMCVGSNGLPDATSIFVDMAGLNNPTGCFGWTVDSCKFDFKAVASIEFNMEMQDCEAVWAAPLWLVPNPWVGNKGAGMSGEVDMAEICPRNQLKTNFAGCGGAPWGKCQQAQWDGVNVSGFSRRKFILNISLTGDLTTQVCNGPEDSVCHPAGYFKDFMSTVIPCKDGGPCSPYSLVSDVWNGFGGDGGWSGCGAANNNQTKCKYALWGIKIHSRNEDVPIFTSGKCRALNAIKVEEPDVQGAQPRGEHSQLAQDLQKKDFHGVGMQPGKLKGSGSELVV